MMAETNSEEGEFVVESSAQGVGFKERGLDKVKQVAATLRNKNAAKDQHYTSVPDADEDGNSCNFLWFCSVLITVFAVL
jgi:hypothetical protein